MRLPFSNFLRRPPESKASRAALVALFEAGRPRWTPRDYAALAREGFANNAIAYRAVRLIAEAVAAVPLVLYEGARELDAHPLLDLIARPNPRQTGCDLVEAATGHLLISGNAYFECVLVAGKPRELFALRPDRMKVVPGAEGWPEAYEYSVAGKSVRFSMFDSPPPILHLTLFNPLDDHYGLSPIEAAASAIDVHNAASGWNKALLDNAARPSGALVYSAGGNLSEEQFERLKRELEAHYQGSANAGRPLLLEGGLDWKALSLIAQGHGFRRGQAHRRARDRAGVRRAADALGHSRRQHLFQLRRGQPQLLSRHRGADGAARVQRGGAVAGARAWAKISASRPTSTRSRRWRPSASRCGSASTTRRFFRTTKNAPPSATARAAAAFK